MLDLLATGYPSLDRIVPISHIPSVGQTALLSEALERAAVTYGGCGANVAVGLQKLGFRTGLAMVVGGDEAGRDYRAYLESAGIDCSNIRRLPGETTSSSYLCRALDGETINFFHPGAADAWRGKLELEGLEDVRWGLVTVGYAPYNRAFVELLRVANVPLIWQMKGDIAAYPPALVSQFMTASRIIFCNRFEADYVCDALKIAELGGVFAQGVKLVILTMGGDGSRVMTPDETCDIPVVPARVVDTTGAGDAYTAGYLAGMWRGYAPSICGKLGAAAAAFAIEVVGCQTHLPDWQSLKKRCEDHFGAL